jgi:hypothetical protein
MGSRRGWVATGLAVARRPRLWSVAARQSRRLARPGWWRRPPFLPLPDPDYVRFRTVTATGRADGAPDPADVVTWLEWVRG